MKIAFSIVVLVCTQLRTIHEKTRSSTKRPYFESFRVLSWIGLSLFGMDPLIRSASWETTSMVVYFLAPRQTALHPRAAPTARRAQSPHASARRDQVLDH